MWRLKKTEVVAFYKRKGKPPPGATITIDGFKIPIKSSMKYLGVILDSKLSFVEHFKYISEKTTKVNRALRRILPNLRGPHESKRRLYANMIQSIIMYGAPVWSDKLEKSKVSQRLLAQVQRITAIRTVAGYRTISYEVATVLARIPPWIMTAKKYQRIYERLQDIKRNDTWTEEKGKDIKEEEDDRMMEEWMVHLKQTQLPGLELRKAIVESFAQWILRPFGGMNFHTTQILSNHGCFRKFLYRIKKSETPICIHCKTAVETAEHTLFECNTWNTERAELMNTLKCENNNMTELIKTICEEKSKWQAFNKFANEVMSQKEEYEREVEREQPQSEGSTRRRKKRDEERNSVD